MADGATATATDAARQATPQGRPADYVAPGKIEVPNQPNAESLGQAEAASAFDTIQDVAGLLKMRIIRGRTGTSTTGWVRVRFPPGAFASTPTVLITPRYRPGWYSKVTLQPPFLDQGRVAEESGNRLRDTVLEHVSIPIIGGALGALAFWVGWGMGWIFAWFMNVVIGIQTAQIETAYNKAAELLYQGSDRPLMKLTTPELRTVARDNFEFLGVPGGNFEWLAIGERGAG